MKSKGKVLLEDRGSQMLQRDYRRETVSLHLFSKEEVIRNFEEQFSEDMGQKTE